MENEAKSKIKKSRKKANPCTNLKAHVTNTRAQLRASDLLQFGDQDATGRERSHSHHDPEMSRKKSDHTRRRATRTRRKIAGRSISGAAAAAAAENRPEWLPADWTMELKKRGESSTTKKRIDRYYICPLSGKRLRSRLEVMRFLDSKLLDHSATESASCDPIAELKGSEVKHATAGEHFVAREETVSNATTEIELADPPQEPTFSSLTHASEQSTNRSTPKNVEELEQRISKSQSEGKPNLSFHAEEQPATIVLPESENEKLLEPLMHSEDDILTVPRADLSDEKRVELTKKQSQPKRYNKCGSSNTEAVSSATNKLSLPKRKAERRESVPIRTSKRLAGVRAEPISNFETEKRLRTPKAREIEQAEPIVTEEAHQDVSITVEEKVNCLNPFAGASKVQQADVPQPAVPKVTDVSCLSNVEEKVNCLSPFAEFSKEQVDMHQPAVPKVADESCLSYVKEKVNCLNPFAESSKEQQSDMPQPAVPKVTDESCLSNVEEIVNCLNLFAEASKEQQTNMPLPAVPKETDESSLSYQKDAHETDEGKEKLEPVEPLVEQASQEQQPEDPLTNMLPFGDSWSDPCIEFAFKTLTSDFPVLEDIAAIQDYLNHQHVSSQGPNLGVGQNPSAFDGPSSLPRDNGKPCTLENGMVETSYPMSKKTM